MKNQQLMFLLGLIGISVGGYFLLNKPKNEENVPSPDQNVVVDEPANQTPVLTQQNNILDGNKVLKIGVNGIETKELQRLLGITQDGVFGNQTQSVLFNKKAVNQITLNKWITTPNNSQNQSTIRYKYKIGDNLVIKAGEKGIRIYLMTRSRFTNIYTTTKDYDVFLNNEVLGKVVALKKSATNTPLYVVENGTVYLEYYLVSELYIR